MASNSFMRGKKKNQWKGSGEEWTVSVLYKYIQQYFIQFTFLLEKKSSKDNGLDIQIMTTPTLGLTSNAKTLLLPKVQFI